MKILLIDIEAGKIRQGTNPHTMSFNTNLLLSFSEPLDDIRTETSFESAYNFIKEELVVKNKYIDFILIHVKSEDAKKANDFSYNIRKSKDSYFNGYFNVSAICIVVVTNYTYTDSVINSHLFSRIIYSFWKETHFIRELGLAINDWRQKLAGELDELNIRLDIDFKNFDSQWAIKYKLHKLNILTSKFINDKERFSFLWLGDNLKSIDYSVSEFHQLMKSKTREKEKKIHEYLKLKERILLGEYKKDFIYERHLYYNGSRKYIEADFINYAYPFYLDNPEIFEVKRPEKKIIRKNNKGFYSHFNSYLDQVSKYYTYLTDPINIVEIEDKLDTDRLKINYKRFDYTMLFSRSEHADECIEQIGNKIDSLPFKMKMLTYDELINRFERFYERIKKYGVR